jgi:hypothetical protein
MKTGLLALCFLCGTAAFGQSAGGTALSNDVQVLEFPSHAVRAAAQPMAQEQNLLGQTGYFYAQGERPLWEVQPLSQSVPLGDIARMLKKEHATAKKADIVRND